MDISQRELKPGTVVAAILACFVLVLRVTFLHA